MPEYSARYYGMVKSVGVFRKQLPEILDFIGDSPVIPFNVIYCDVNNQPVPDVVGIASNGAQRF